MNRSRDFRSGWSGGWIVHRHQDRFTLGVRGREHHPVRLDPRLAPYKHGLLAMDYEVIDLIEGVYDHPTLVAAHWVIRDGDVLEGAERRQGETYRLTLELYDDHAELEGQRLVMETNEFALPLYYDPDS